MDANSLEKIADALLLSYELDQAERPRLPSRKAVVDVLDNIRRILFPGYYAEVRLPLESRRHYVGTWLCELHSEMTRIIDLAYAHASPDYDPGGGQAEALTTLFLEALPSLRAQLRLDAEAALAGDPAAQSVEEVILTYPGFQAITVHRVAHWLNEQGIPFIPRVMSEHAHTMTGIDIHPGAKIGNYFFIDHGTGVVIGETCEIGERVKLYQGVTLGALSFPTDGDGNIIRNMKRHPTICDGVVVYASATVLGGKTTIGKDCVIGSNVWITRSVDPRTTVTLEKPKLRMRGDDSHSLQGEANYQI